MFFRFDYSIDNTRQAESSKPQVEQKCQYTAYEKPNEAIA